LSYLLGGENQIPDFEMSFTGVDHDGDIGGVSNNNSEEFRRSEGMDFVNEEGLFDNEGHLNQHLFNQNSVSQDGELFDVSFAIPNSIIDEEMHGFRRDSASEPINILVNDSQHTTITMSSQSSVRNTIVTTCLLLYIIIKHAI
jgi:hypothetical protein